MQRVNTVIRSSFATIIIAVSFLILPHGVWRAAQTSQSSGARRVVGHVASDRRIPQTPGGEPSTPVKVRGQDIEISIQSDLRFLLDFSGEMKSSPVDLASKPGLLSMVKLVGSGRPEKFHVVRESVSTKIKHTEYGEARVVSFTAFSRDSGLSEEFDFLVPVRFHNTIICETFLRNEGRGKIRIASYGLLRSLLDAKKFGADSSYKFWSFQGGSYPERYDWIFPLDRTYRRDNYQGMNASDYGGGIPVVGFWTRELGIAFSVVDQKPRLVSLPVRVTRAGAVSFSITDTNEIVMQSGDSTQLVRTAIILHHGDFFNGLRTYSDLLQTEGFHYPKAPPDAFEPEWCAWGYERDFNKEQILKSLPTVKKLGFGWVTIDDGWQNNMGDWYPNLAKFPGGEKDFEAFIDSIHSYGLKVRLWWSPLSAQDSTYGTEHYQSRMHEYGFNIQSKLALEHPDWFMLDKNGNRVRVSWWNSYLLCPALSAVRHYYEDLVERLIVKWKIDGFKLDGQDLNMVPGCFNPDHHHESPIASVDAVPIFFKDIYSEATKLKKGFLIQLCPCGTNFSICNLPYLSQTVASDPLSSWQVRLKGKTFRALYGSQTEAHSGDHVELTNHVWNDSLQTFVVDGEPDFASTLAVGGGPAFMFTMPGFEQADSSLELTPMLMKYYRKWIAIYNKERLSEGRYLNLYDIAYYKPETNVIKRGTSYYYFFFARRHFSGNVEFRGLTARKYKAYNLYTGRFISKIAARKPTSKISFDKYMVVKLVRVGRLAKVQG